MKNGYSSIFKDLNANILAAIVFFCGALFGFFSGFAGWLGAICFALIVILFFIEQNPFVRRACFIVILVNVLTLVCWLLFKVILPFKFFNVINWIIDIAATIYLVYAGLCAINGKKVEVPFLGGFVDSVCK